MASIFKGNQATHCCEMSGITYLMAWCHIPADLNPLQTKYPSAGSEDITHLPFQKSTNTRSPRDYANIEFLSLVD